MDRTSSLRKNPSRESCEQTIRRILTTEMLERGVNDHFKNAADFMPYFESLYPASAGLTKQVQRAVKSLAMPKDERGYFIPNKTIEQANHEKELRSLLKAASAKTVPFDSLTPVFLQTEPQIIDYLISVISGSPLFDGKYTTIIPCSNGIIFYTDNASQLNILLESLIS
jgi:hypothetical protein